jgi:hypothetical protein
MQRRAATAGDRTRQSIALSVDLAYRKYLSKEGGFLCPTTPIETLPRVFERFEVMAKAVPRLLDATAGGGARGELDRQFARVHAESLGAIRDLSEVELYRLMTVMCYLGHAYRWNTIPPTRMERERRVLALPPGIEQPWQEVATKLDLPCASGFFSSFCYDWRLRGRSGGEPYENRELTLANMSFSHTWLKPPYAEHAERFFLAFVLTEARGAPVVRDVVAAMEAAAARDEHEATRCLARLRGHLHELSRELSSIMRRSVVRVDIWMDYVQPFFGWGLETEGGGVLHGASGMQAATFEALNVSLGLKSESRIARETKENRRYMPLFQRRFLAALDDAGPMLREFVLESKNQELKRAFNECLDCLVRWRVGHQARGAMYLRGEFQEGEFVSASSTGGLIGPGDKQASDYSSYMEERIVETVQAKVPTSD